jgi:hypothetical protein
MEARDGRDTHGSFSFCYIVTIFVCGLVQHTEHYPDAMNIFQRGDQGPE